MTEKESSMLTWGRRYLMCRPWEFDVTYGINPWMQGRAVDRALASDQWRSLVDILTTAGATVEMCDPVPGLPDMVFAANCAVVEGGRALLSRFRHPERRPEAGHYATHLERLGYEIVLLPADCSLEGNGDVLPFGNAFVAGHGFRSNRAGLVALRECFGRAVIDVELVEPRLYHLDLAFCPVTDTAAIVAPSAFSAKGLARLLAHVPDPILLDEEETLRFMANSLVAGQTVVLPDCSSRLEAELNDRGLECIVHDATEFQKAGGATRCLALVLDIDLGSSYTTTLSR